MAETDGGTPNEGYDWEEVEDREREYVYDPETDRIIHASNDTPPGWEPPPSSWETMDASLKGYAPFDRSKGFNPTELEPGPPAPGSDEDRIQKTILDEIRKQRSDEGLPALSDADLGALGIRITHELGAKQGLTARDFVDLYSGMSSDDIKSAVDRAMHDITIGTDRGGDSIYDYGRDYMEKLYGHEPVHLAGSNIPWGMYYETPGQGLPPVSSYATGFAPTAPAPTSFAEIRHDPDLLDRYYRALNVYHDALGRGLTDAERQKLADTITRGGLWKELDELRARQEKAAAEYYSPKAPQAEDYGLRHPEYSPVPPLLKTGYQVYDSSAGGGLAQAGRPPLFQVIDTIKTRKGSAKDAMQYILDQTYGGGKIDPSFAWGIGGLADNLAGRVPHSNLSGLGAGKGDFGFQPQFMDDQWYSGLWGYKDLPHTTQLGHFLTAVDMGLDGGDWLKSAMINHEQIPDDALGGFGAAALAFAKRASPEDMAAFDSAVTYDKLGDYDSRDKMLRSILEKPDLKPWQTREGNSLEDLALSVKGWELGREIARGELKTSKDVADWIAGNIAEGYY